MLVSLIICSRNRRGALKDCLIAIDTELVAKISGEIILVDSASTDNSQEVMSRFAAQAACDVHVVEMATPGLGRARNAGIESASGEIIAFTDDDCYLDESYYHEVGTVLAERELDYCGGRVLLYDPSDAQIGTRCKDSIEPIPPRSFVPAGQILGANMVFRREVLEEVDGFDPEIGAGTPYRFEDVDIIARASLQGFTGAYVPELVVHHHHRRKPGADVREIQHKNDFARGAYFAKFMFSGHALLYLSEWRRRRIWVRMPRKTLEMWPKFKRELAGAYSYLRSNSCV